MLDGRPLVWSTVAVILVVSLLSGPLVGPLDFTREPVARTPAPGTGSATVTVEDVPDEITLERTAFGAGTYHLEAPAARVTARSVTGNPTLRYSIDIPGLWFSDARAYPLAGRSGDRIALEFRPVELSPTRVENESYEARLAIWLVTDGGTYHTAYQAPIVVEVAP